MASHEQLAQFGKSPSTTSDEDDASTSSEDVDGVPSKLLKTSTKSVGHDHTRAMQVDSPTSSSKPRLKLKLRAPVTKIGCAGGNLVNGRQEASKKPSPKLLTSQKIPNPGAPAVASLPVKIEDDLRVPHSDASGDKIVDTTNMSIRSEGNGSNGEKKGKLTLPGVKAKSIKSDIDFASLMKQSVAVADTKVGAVASSSKALKLAKGSPEGKSKVKGKASVSMNGTTKTSSGSASSEPPKKRTKLPKLPLSTKRKLPLKGGDASETTSSVAKATVIAVDEDVEADAVATVVEAAPVKSISPAAKTQPSVAAKKRPQQPGKPIRLPPLTSPGLLIPQATAGVTRAMVNPEGFATPEAVFELAMASAGYSLEARSKEPHRGSSVQRVVGDMFDSNVVLALNFPTLVPSELWSGIANGAGDNAQASTSLPSILLKSLGKREKRCDLAGDQEELNRRENGSRKRQRPCPGADMLPLSLTIPYPESYIQSRLNFVNKVQERERAIVLQQETQEKLEIALEEKELMGGQVQDAEPPKVENPVEIPPIPTPPPPPLLSEFTGVDADQYEGDHPFYIPKGKKTLVAHLDQNCFHIAEGRYFGLSSNFVADPHFVGANAPGISGLTLSVGSGLATISTNSGSGVHVTAASSMLAAPVAPALPSTKSSSKCGAESAAGSSIEKTTTKKEVATATKPPKKTTATLPTLAKSGNTGKLKSKHMGPAPTANAADLRKVMEGTQGAELVESMRTCIIRAAVHASRSGKHNQSFFAPDGKAYPDVSKAFAAHAGLKPCSRCKNNKQGAYHCRLRRKHKELDHDGGNSPGELAPLLATPMEELLLDSKTIKHNT